LFPQTDTGDDEHAYDHQATAYASPPLSPLSFDGKFGFGMSASPPVARAVSPLGPLAGVGGLVGFEAKAPDVRRGSRTIPLPEIDDECGSTPTSKSPGWTTMTLPEVGDGELKFDYTFVQVATAYEGVGGVSRTVYLEQLYQLIAPCRVMRWYSYTELAGRRAPGSGR
jgi:hypothetical protein